MADAKTTEQRDKAWWDAWWGEDFSWDGLAEKSWDGWLVLPDGSVAEEKTGGAQPPEGARAATLQDYWREQEPDLVTSPDGGQRFTRVHLPPAWKDGTPTGKADWPDDALDAVLAPKLQAGTETAFHREQDDTKLVGSDGRAQLQGAVLLGAATQPQGNASQLSARFNRAAFLRDADFAQATFSGDASFSNATFSGDASFANATFSGDAYFKEVTFSGGAYFKEATFSGGARFDSATFSGNANFPRASFSEGASFYCATFSGPADFTGATFSGPASFDSATFSGGASFYCATVEGFASFHGATFSGDASFDSATFLGVARFYSAIFSGNAKFWNAVFLGATEFGGAVFEKPVSFSKIVWPSAAQNWHKAFDQTLFKSAPVFTKAGFKSLAAFDGAVLERGLVIDDPRAAETDKAFVEERRGAIKAAKADLAAWIEIEEDAWIQEQEQEQEGDPSEVEGKGEGEGDKKKPKRISGGERRRQLEKYRNYRLAELEGGCRTLKKAMEYASNKTREQLFYRYELIARRAQAATPLSEKIFSYLYDWFGNYGASIGRPFMAVTGLTLLFSGVYWGLDIGWGDAASHAVALNPTTNVDPALERALSFSASRIFPFGAFDDVSAGWLQSYETAHGSLAALGVRILASLQSTFALTLVFMVGLAVRRKFQIS